MIPVDVHGTVWIDQAGSDELVASGFGEPPDGGLHDVLEAGDRGESVGDMAMRKPNGSPVAAMAACGPRGKSAAAS